LDAGDGGLFVEGGAETFDDVGQAAGEFGGLDAGAVRVEPAEDQAVDVDALPRLVATASSDGVVRLWDMRRASGDGAEPLASAATRARGSCSRIASRMASEI
jgi:hypothetical protein